VVLIFCGLALSLSGDQGVATCPAHGPNHRRATLARLAHAILPIPGKRDADWSFAWIPIVGPIIGGALGAVIYTVLFGRLSPLNL
jgi:glycerol uptake facilitator protein